MKFPHFILLIGLSISAALGDVETRRAEAMGKPMESFRAMNGRIYNDVMITKISAGGVSFKHADGTARLRFDELSPGQREYFGIEQDEAEEVYRAEAQRRAAYEEQVAKLAEERRILAEKAAAESEAAWELAMAAAAEERAAAAAEKPAETIPLYPTIQRVDTRSQRNRSYGYSSNSYFGGYSGFSGYRPYFRGGAYCARPTALIVIRR